MYQCVLSLQRWREDHSLGTAALQEGRPKFFMVGSGDGASGFQAPSLSRGEGGTLHKT